MPTTQANTPAEQPCLIIHATESDGTRLVHNVGPRSLLVFLDETGCDKFKNPAYPVFGLGGCAVLAANYTAAIDQPWRALKRQFLGSDQLPLHAAEFRRQLTQPGAHQRMADFFSAGQFWRFAAMVPIDADLGGAATYRAAAMVVFNRLRDILQQSHEACEVVLCVETGRDRQVKAHLADQRIWADREEIPIHRHLVSKKVGLQGMEVADFVLHASGSTGSKRVKKGDHSYKGADYRAVFSAQPHLTSYFWVTRYGIDTTR